MLSRRLAVTFATLLLLWGGAAAAQGGNPQGGDPPGGDRMAALAKTTPEQRAKVQTAMMKEKLALSEGQLPAVEKINLDAATRMQPILESNDRPLIKMRQAKDIATQRNASLEQVLEPAQYEQWLAQQEAIRAKVEEKLMEKRAGGGAP